jgi:hypothetical protein
MLQFPPAMRSAFLENSGGHSENLDALDTIIENSEGYSLPSEDVIRRRDRAITLFYGAEVSADEDGAPAPAKTMGWVNTIPLSSFTVIDRS